jgi:hypothetical protein
VVALLLHLKKLDQLQPDDAVLSPDFWLATSALCVVNADVIEAINSLMPTAPKVYCGNHDDGATEAIVTCADCALPLCAECDDTLHLPRGMRAHTRSAFERQEATLLLEQHEGCGRVKMPLIVALCDRRTMKVRLFVCCVGFF